MDYENKLALAKEALDSGSYDMNISFPNLKRVKSEDEKIRKEIISHLKYLGNYCQESMPNVNEWIAWLEKQGKNNMGISEATKQELKDNLNKALEKETPESWNEFLDEQQPVDKIEPKFHEGEWIIFNEHTFYIKEVAVGFYKTISKDDITYNYDWCIDKMARLWTVEDAKDGDVLCSNQIIILFKQWEDDSDCNFVIAHAGIDISGKLQITDGHWLISNESKPATEEQRDLLFQKIKESGYEWDAEKKELKKIEQKPTEISGIEHVEHGKYYYCIKDYYAGGKKWASKGEVVQALRGMSMMALGVKANEYFLPVNSIKQDPALSEEDKKKLSRIYSILGQAADEHAFSNTCRLIGDKECVELQDFLKSLKDRYCSSAQT